MAVRQIVPQVHHVGVLDWDRRLFDKLIPLPHGTTYNSYIIQGSEKTAIIDTAYPQRADELLNNLKKLNLDKIDYIIANHGEQDHSGTAPELLRMYPDAKIVTNAKCITSIVDMLMVDRDKFIEVKEGDTLSLGDKTLQFMITPWVHWPDTMVTHLIEDKILFTCDFFGSHLATSKMFAIEHEVYEPAKRYYAEIMMPFRKQIQKHIARIEPMDLAIIAPSHGPLYNNPKFIIEAYKDWVSDEVKNEVIIPYVSMYESTEKLVLHLTDCLIERGVNVKPFNVTESDLGDFAVSAVDAATIVVGSSMVLAGAHPAIVPWVFMANAIRPKVKYAAIIGSYGWGGNMIDQIGGLMSNLKVEMLDNVIVKGHPREEDFEKVKLLADQIAERHKPLM